MIEIINYVENRNPESPLQGHVLIQVKKKVQIWYSVVRSKKTGNIFCQPASILIEGNYHPSFNLQDSIAMKNLTNNILKLIKEEDPFQCF